MASIYYRIYDATFSVVEPLGDFAKAKTVVLLTVTQWLYALELFGISSWLFNVPNLILKYPFPIVKRWIIIGMAIGYTINFAATIRYTPAHPYARSSAAWLFFITPAVLFIPSMLPLWLPYSLPMSAAAIALMWLIRQKLTETTSDNAS